MNTVAFAFSLATLATLNVLVFVGSALPDSAAGAGVIGAVAPLMDLCLVVSSIMLGLDFVRQGCRLLGILFLLNIVIVVASVAIRVAGIMFPRWLLFGADLYWLNLYALTATRVWRIVGRQSLA